jgi:hypothetical protein
MLLRVLIRGGRREQILVAKGAHVASLDWDSPDRWAGPDVTFPPVKAPDSLGEECVTVAGLSEQHEQGGVRVHQQHLDEERTCQVWVGGSGHWMVAV